MSQISPINYYDNYAFCDENKTELGFTQPPVPQLSQAEVAVKINDVRLAYGRHQVLTGINMFVPAKRIYGLLGPSGCGMFSFNQQMTKFLH